MPSIKTNIFWNIIRVTSNLLFPLITFPYASRILGPESIGLFNYAFAIASYFTLFASFGFPIYGMREVAVRKNDLTDLETATNSIFSANLLLTVFVCIAYLLLCTLIAGDNIILFLIVGISILLSSISFEWFYQGIEDFRYLTIRGIIIKSISVICLFLFVKNCSDLLYYAIVSVGATCGNNILNLIRLKKFIRLRLTRNGVWRHIRGASVLFMGTVAVSFYSYMNDILVGALDNMTSVGYFSTGNKLVHIILSIIGVISMSIIPRMTSLVNSNKQEETLQLQRKSINLVLYVSIPIMIGLFVLSPQIVNLFAGNKFAPTANVTKILALLIAIIPLSSFLGYQVLIPNRKEKYGNYATIGGAVTNIALALILIPQFSYIGSCVSLVIAESVVTGLHFYYSRRYMNLQFRDFIPLKCIVSSLVMLFVLVGLLKISNNPYMAIAWSCVGALVYCGTLFILRDSFSISQLQTIFRRK